MALTDKLSAIGEAIRAKTGKSDKLTLDQMPGEIAGITGGGSDVTLLEGLSFELDFSNGDMPFAAPNGYAVKSAIVKKPDTLIPANIKSGVEVAGITGTLSGGGANPDANDPVYYVTFMNGDQVLYVRPVAENDNCADVVSKGWCEKPTKESTATEVFTHSGWSATDGGTPNTSILNNITADKTVYATYTVSERKYTITYLEDDGSVKKTEQLPYGAMPSYAPKKEGYLISWSPELSPVTADATYTAVWVVSDIVDSGECGDSATWTYKNDGKLTISGSGAMADYTSSGVPWYQYRSSITNVVIEDGITHIGEYSFYGVSDTSITVPEGVTSIGKWAFSSKNIQTVNLPTTLTTIDGYAFNASGITSIVIPDGVARIEYGTFDYCSKLSSITIGSGVTFIDTAQFKNTALTSATFKVTSGWKSSQTASGSQSSLTYDLSSTSSAASALKNAYDYNRRYWHRT